MIYFLIAGIALALDQWTKWLVKTKMEFGEQIPLIEGVLYLTSYRNAGAAFGILQNQRWFFISITIIVIIGILYFLLKYKKIKKLMSSALALILGGAIGNFIDRLLYGEVIDFLDVKISIGSFYYDFPIFNIADSVLVIGVGLLLLDTLMESIKEMKHNKKSAT